MISTPELKEEYSSKIPALQVLMNLGWEYLSPTQCSAKRGGVREVMLRDELIRVLKARRFRWKGQKYPLSTNAIDQIIRELSTPGIHEGLLTANERVYDKLCLGVTVTEFIDGKKVSPTIPLIDWEVLENNVFQVTEEMEVQNASGTGKRIPDLVCFVNGIPLVVVEAKRPESGNPNKSMVDEGVSQTIRNQKNDEIPHLFAYAQLMLAISSTEGRYGTTKTPAKFWAKWRDEEIGEQEFREIKNRPLAEPQKNILFADRSGRMRAYFEELWAKEVAVTDQDRLIIGLLSKGRLLEMIRYFTLFDKKVGKIMARYQQVFGVKKMLARVQGFDEEGSRQGGVIWHTTGSGKSFTMVFMSKAMLLHPELAQCRLIVVTDRINLEKQLSGVFLTSGAFGSAVATKKDGARAKVSSGRDLAKRIGSGTDRIIFTIVDKFSTASGLKECFNPSDKIIVLVDEGHRSHGGETHQRMRKALPRAAYVAFTGTPLLKEDKTQNRFGPIIHAYTMQRAVDDGTVTALLYEERKPALDLNEEAIDNWFDKLTSELSNRQKADLKKKFATKGAVYRSENRVELIAWDIATHFKENFKELRTGLKAQLATDSKLSAVRYKKYLDKTGLVSSAVVISPPDTREGHKDVDESELPEVQKWFKKVVGRVGNAQQYEREIIDDFAEEGAPDILIVVDKLLTGFDEPRNAVLYIDKPLKEHSLIQAIARVNRLHKAKDYGLLIDYRGILKELDVTIGKYQDLEERTQGGFDIDDLEGLYRKVDTEYKKLPGLHDKLWAIFEKVENKLDTEQFRQKLMPKWGEDEEGHFYDTNQKIREDFYTALTKFGMCLKVALSSHSFYEDGSFSEEDIRRYKKDLRFFTGLRNKARQDAQEKVNYSDYEEQIRHLADKHVVGKDIEVSAEKYLVDQLGKPEDPGKWSKEKLRNETDTIMTRVKKTIEQNLEDDPYAQKVFSELLKKAIKQAETMFDHPYKQYALFKEFEEKVHEGELEGIPRVLKDNPPARAFYGALRLTLGEERIKGMDPAGIEGMASEALTIEEVVNKAMAEHSLNPKSMEASISKGLLPRLFKLIGLEKAKEAINQITHITRVRLNQGSN